MKPFLLDESVFGHYHSLLKHDEQSRPNVLSQLADLYRIQTLAGLKAANHGWLGASFSCTEILTTIFHQYIPDPSLSLLDRHAVFLSKGHAVMTQYAILAALGAFPISRLLDYKALNGLPAHCDREIPGVDSDSGSLGQGLSKAIGLALRNRQERRPFCCFALLGDGEMQEGQLFEALLTLKHQGLTNCIPILDRNYLQSDSQTDHIKDAANWEMVFKGIGLKVETIEGHRPDQILWALDRARMGPTPTVIIAETVKGCGSKVTAMPASTERRKGVWHGKIPSDEEYLEILEEIVGRLNNPEISKHFHQYRGEARPALAVSPVKPTTMSTGEAFGESLVKFAKVYNHFFVLDADLEKACRLGEFARQFPRRFFEIGISEQDLVSIGAGIGLGKGIAVVNTYASFYKRCIDQVAACAAEKLPVIFAGHYSGLDYFTDGKSHQSLNDIGFMRAIQGLEIFEPFSPEETRQTFSYLIQRMTEELQNGKPSRPAYLRLHRTPVEGLPPFSGSNHPGEPLVFPSSVKICHPPRRLFVASPQMLSLALSIQQQLANEKIPLEVVGVRSYEDPHQLLLPLLENSSALYSLESHFPSGGLADFLLSLHQRPLMRFGPRALTGSTRTFQDMLEQHQLTIPHLVEKLTSLP